MLRVEKKPNISLYTSGACAVAAVKGAVDMLMSGEIKEETVVSLPACVRVRFRLLDAALGTGAARCAVAKKWSGIDGLDDTVLIYAKATKTKKAGDIVINYKKGIGRYTKNVGSYRKKDAAVSPEVKFLMKNAILDLWEGRKINYGVMVEISCPKGAEVAKKTVNEAYSIYGGIALIGSYGVSVKEDNISRLDRMSLSMKKARLGGLTKLVFSETNHSDIFAGLGISVDPEKYITYKDQLEEISAVAEDIDIDGYLFINNLTNALPLCCGIKNNSLPVQNAVLAAHAAKCGVSPEDVSKILSAADTQSAYDIIIRSGKDRQTAASVSEAVRSHLRERFSSADEVECIIFTKRDGIICKSPGADELLEKINSAELAQVDFGKLAMQELLSDGAEEDE